MVVYTKEQLKRAMKGVASSLKRFVFLHRQGATERCKMEVLETATLLVAQCRAMGMDSEMTVNFVKGLVDDIDLQVGCKPQLASLRVIKDHGTN